MAGQGAQATARIEQKARLLVHAIAWAAWAAATRGPLDRDAFDRWYATHIEVVL